jgi:hypothetical protein
MNFAESLISMLVRARSTMSGVVGEWQGAPLPISGGSNGNFGNSACPIFPFSAQQRRTGGGVLRA